MKLHALEIILVEMSTTYRHTRMKKSSQALFLSLLMERS